MRVAIASAIGPPVKANRGRIHARDKSVLFAVSLRRSGRVFANLRGGDGAVYLGDTKRIVASVGRIGRTFESAEGPLREV
jgi:hypothetical protein